MLAEIFLLRSEQAARAMRETALPHHTQTGIYSGVELEQTRGPPDAQATPSRRQFMIRNTDAARG